MISCWIEAPWSCATFFRGCGSDRSTVAAPESGPDSSGSAPAGQAATNPSPPATVVPAAATTSPEPWLPVALSRDLLDLTVEVPACPSIASIVVTRSSGDDVITVVPRAQSCIASSAVVHATVRLPGPYPLCGPARVLDGASGHVPSDLAPDATSDDIASLMAGCPSHVVGGPGS